MTEPGGFLSYVRLDDEHEDGVLSEFRERLSSEVRLQTGRTFPIFQDRNAIAWGQNWRRRVEDAIDSSTVLVAIVAPTFFESPACRGEVERFMEREKALSRDDLILPVYYVSSDQMDDEELRRSDPIAAALHEHQYVDWRELRFDPLTSPHVRRVIAELAKRIRVVVGSKRNGLLSGKTGAAQLTKRKADEHGEAEASNDAALLSPADGDSSIPSMADGSRKTPSPTRIVDPWGRGDYIDLSEALSEAQAGDRLLIRPGVYDGPFVIDKPLELIGEGKREEIVLQCRNQATFSFKTTMGRVANMSFRQLEPSGGEEKARKFCILISQGRLELESCDIRSAAGSAVAVMKGADPRIRDNLIHDCATSGILVTDQGMGTIEDNEITHCKAAGVTIMNASDPTLRRNVIHRGLKSGVRILKDGRGLLEENEISENKEAGLLIYHGGRPTCRENYIHDNGYEGIWIHDGGGGLFEGNQILRNEMGSWDLAESAGEVTRIDNEDDPDASGLVQA